MNKHAITVMVSAAVAALLLGGCGGAEVEKTQITLLHGWGTMEEDHVAMRRIYEDFEKENPDVSLNLLSMPSSQEVIYKANDMLAVGEIPDLIFAGGIGRDSMYQFMVNKGYAVDLMPYLEADETFEGDVSPVITRYWETPEGQLYTVSDVLLYSGGYWYNEDIFRQAGIENIPRNWEEFGEDCLKIENWSGTEKNDVIPIQLNGENSLYLTDFLLLDVGEDSREAILEHKPQISQPQLAAVIDQLSVLHEYSMQTQNEYGYRDILKQFNEGKSAMYLNGVWAGSMIEEGLPVRYAALPSADGSTVACTSSCLGYVVGNTGNPDKIDAAVRFLKYMLSDKVQERIMKETGQVPSNPGIELEADGMPRFIQAVRTVGEADIHLEVPDNIWDIRRINLFKNQFMDVLNGELSRQTFMDLLR